MMCRSSHSSCIFTPSHFISEGGVGPLFERGPEVGPFLSWELTQTPVHVYSRDITEIPSWSGTVLSATRALKKGPTLIPAHMGQTTEQYYPHILFSLNGRYSCEKDHFPCVNPRTYTESHTLTVVKGGGGWWYPPGFFICCNISKRFCLEWKAFDRLYKMRYILWLVTLLEVCDVTKHGRHLGRHLLTQIITLHHFIHKFYFYCWKKLKKHAFSLKNG